MNFSGISYNSSLSKILRDSQDMIPLNTISHSNDGTSVSPVQAHTESCDS